MGNNGGMKTRFSLSAACLAGLLLVAPRADAAPDPLPGIALGATSEVLSDLLEERCSKLKRIDTARPTLPLARNEESYLICLGYKDPDGAHIEEIGFTFADGSLVVIEARGGAVDAILPRAGEVAWRMIGLDVYVATSTVVDPALDAVWIVAEEGLHPHLFTWSNPHLPSFEGPVPLYDASAARPDILEFGGDLEQLSPRLKRACPRTDTDVEDSPWLPTGPETQLQINCYEYVYAGFPRKIEAVFGDGRLELAWILTGKGEEGRVREALVAAFGEPVFVSDTVEAFDDWRVALRKDKPEVLMVIDELAPVFRREFGGDE
jgi:hypothetical protein